MKVKIATSRQYNKESPSDMKAHIYNMDKIYAALQQNRGNIWSQYFPHCLPSPHNPSLFTLYVLHSHTIPCMSLPPGSPKLSSGCQQREIWFPVYTGDSQKRKWEQFSAHKQYMASASSCPSWMSYMCRYFASSYIRCYSVKGWCWMGPSRHCLWKLCVCFLALQFSASLQFSL